MIEDKLFESILDDITVDDNIQQSSSVLANDEDINALPLPYDSDYKYLFEVGGWLTSDTDESIEKMTQNTVDAIFDILDNCKGIKKYSDIEANYDRSGALYFIFSIEPQFKKPSEILHFINNLYVASYKMKRYGSSLKATSPWIKYVEYNKDTESYDMDYSNTIRECELLNRRLRRERNSVCSDSAFGELLSMVCTLIGNRELNLSEFCNFMMCLIGHYDLPKLVLYMISGFTIPEQRIVLPLIARSETVEKTVDFRNLVLKWTKFTYVFRIPSSVMGETRERVPNLMPVRDDCEDSALRDEICDMLENNNDLKIQEPYIFKHNTCKGDGGQRLSVICRAYTGKLDYAIGIVITVPVTKEEDNAYKIASWVLSGMFKEGLSLEAKRQIEK